MKNKTVITPEAAMQMQRNDRVRLLIMAFAVVALGLGYLFTRSQEKKYRTQEEEEARAALPDETDEAPTATVVVPEFDMPEVLEGVRDSTPAERVVVDGDALTAVFNYGRLLTPRHYDAAGRRDLDATTLAEIEADPGAHRVQALRVRGTIEAVGKRRRRENLPEEWAGSVRLEDGGHAHFVVLEKPAEVGVGDFVRFDGMFLKLYSTEAPDGEGRIEGPLVCGGELVPSFPRIDLAGEVSLDRLESVRDDQAGDVSGMDENALWQLMAYAKAGNSNVDWDTVPAIDGQKIGEILADGDAFRGQPFRLDISRNLGCWTEAAGENPLRLDRMTIGWIGNQTWKGQVPIIKFFAPMSRPELRDRNGESKYLTGRAYFLRNHVYERDGGDIGRAPVFVMEALDVFEVEPDPMPRYVMWGVLGGAVVMIVLLWTLLMRDRKKSAALQEELVRRRRARRARMAMEGGASSSES